jgi:hypothetical protein
MLIILILVSGEVYFFFKVACISRLVNFCSTLPRLYFNLKYLVTYLQKLTKSVTFANVNCKIGFISSFILIETYVK